MTKSFLPTITTDGSLRQYLKDIKKFPMLEAREEYMLAKNYINTGDTKAAHKLVTSHLRLVAKCARGYQGYGLPMSEVIAEGNLGLMKAVKKFNPDKGFRLATYALWWIRASIQEYILRSWSLVKIATTNAQKRLFFNLRRLKNEMQVIDKNYMQPNQVKKIADKLQVQEKEVIQMEGRLKGSDHSLNQPIKTQGADIWQDVITDETDNQETNLIESEEYQKRKQILLEAIKTLNEREQKILTARRLTSPPQTLETLSTQFNISRERIRQIENRAFEKLTQKIHTHAQQIGLLEDKTKSPSQ